MQAIIKYSVGILCLAILFGCATSHTEAIKKAAWLIGTWENKGSRQSMYETWSKINDRELSGKSYLLKGGEPVVLETIRLLQEQDSLFYVPVVNNQNEGLPVRFSATLISETVMVFENLHHDLQPESLI